MSDDESDSGSASSSSSGPSAADEPVQPQKKQRTSKSVPPPLEIAPTADAAKATIQNQANSSSIVGNKSKNESNKLIIILDQARLETIKNRRGNYELLNCDDHRDLCKKKLKKDPKEFRPDICHQELLALLDSPLNKSGHLQVYIRTSQNVLIELHPSVRIPRTYKRFAGLMVQLLHKMKIKASENGTTLMKVIKNPMSQHLPVGVHVYGMSCQGTLYSPLGLAKALVPLDPNAGETVCFVIGAMAAGHVTVEDHPYIEKMISISEYPLSGAAAINRILGAIEHQWGIV